MRVAGPAARSPRRRGRRAAATLGLVGLLGTGMLTGCETPPPRTLATYVWSDVVWTEDGPEFGSLLDELAARGVSDVYLDVTRAVTHTRTAPSSLPSYLDDLDDAVGAAEEHGIAVHALFGDPTWSTTDRQGASDALGVVALFEQENPGRLAGVQFDVEPWGLPSWGEDKLELVTSYVEFVEDVAAGFRDLGLPGRLGFAIPYWFDGASEALTPSEAPLPALLAILADSADPYLVVMAYRDHPDGPDGSAALMVPNLAQVPGSGVELLVGQETAPVTPAAITYDGASAEEFESALVQLRDELGAHPGFGGIAVDDAASYVALGAETHDALP